LGQTAEFGVAGRFIGVDLQLSQPVTPTHSRVEGIVQQIRLEPFASLSGRDARVNEMHKTQIDKLLNCLIAHML
jgi:hypothetical protein